MSTLSRITLLLPLLFFIANSGHCICLNRPQHRNCTLGDFSATNIVSGTGGACYDPCGMKVEMYFSITHMHRINRMAKECNVKLHVCKSFKKIYPKRPHDGTPYWNSSTIDYHRSIGHAILFHLTVLSPDGSKYCDEECIRNPPPSCREQVMCFIEKIRTDYFLRWTADFVSGIYNQIDDWKFKRNDYYAQILHERFLHYCTVNYTANALLLAEYGQEQTGQDSSPPVEQPMPAPSGPEMIYPPSGSQIMHAPGGYPVGYYPGYGYPYAHGYDTMPYPQGGTHMMDPPSGTNMMGPPGGVHMMAPPSGPNMHWLFGTDKK